MSEVFAVATVTMSLLAGLLALLASLIGGQWPRIVATLDIARSAPPASVQLHYAA